MSRCNEESHVSHGLLNLPQGGVMRGGEKLELDRALVSDI